MIHSAIDTTNGIHIPYSKVFATSAVRTSSTFTTADVGKDVLQSDNNVTYKVIATTPAFQVESPQGLQGDVTVATGGTATVTLTKQGIFTGDVSCLTAGVMSVIHNPSGIGFFVPSAFSTDFIVIAATHSGTISTCFATVTSAPTATCVINVLLGTTFTTMTTIFADGTTSLTIAATSGYIGYASAFTVTTVKVGYVIGILVVTPASGYNLGVTIRMT